MNSRFVYSTETGSICRKCGKATASCTCKVKNRPFRKLFNPVFRMMEQ